MFICFRVWVCFRLSYASGKNTFDGILKSSFLTLITWCASQCSRKIKQKFLVAVVPLVVITSLSVMHPWTYQPFQTIADKTLGILCILEGILSGDLPTPSPIAMLNADENAIDELTSMSCQPVAEYIISNQDRFSTRHFLNVVHEKECHKYGSRGKTNPKLILLDFSMAMIQAFCAEDLNQYLDSTHSIMTGCASDQALQQSLLHICASHVLKMCRRNAIRLGNKEQDEKSLVQFASRPMGRLINCKSLGKAERIVDKAIIVLRTEKATQDMQDALCWLE